MCGIVRDIFRVGKGKVRDGWCGMMGVVYVLGGCTVMNMAHTCTCTREGIWLEIVDMFEN